MVARFVLQLSAHFCHVGLSGAGEIRIQLCINGWQFPPSCGGFTESICQSLYIFQSLYNRKLPGLSSEVKSDVTGSKYMEEENFLLWLKKGNTKSCISQNNMFSIPQKYFVKQTLEERYQRKVKNKLYKNFTHVLHSSISVVSRG